MTAAALAVSWATTMLALGTVWAVIFRWSDLARRSWYRGFSDGIHSPLAAVRAALTDDLETESRGQDSDSAAEPDAAGPGPAGGDVGDESRP